MFSGEQAHETDLLFYSSGTIGVPEQSQRQWRYIIFVCPSALPTPDAEVQLSHRNWTHRVIQKQPTHDAESRPVLSRLWSFCSGDGTAARWDS